MTSTPNAKTATAARVAGFLALFAAGTALLVLFAAAAHAALGASSRNAEHAVAMHRPGAAPHLRHQHSGLHKDGGRHSRPDHQVHAHQVVVFRSHEVRPAHSGLRAQLVSLRSDHKTALPAHAHGGARHAHSELGWLL
jgi:hypothetical protein